MHFEAGGLTRFG